MSIDARRAIVRAETLLATELFQSVEETRYYLRGTMIQPHPSGGTIAVATDGHTMAAIHEANGFAEGLPAIWSVQARARLAKLLPSRHDTVRTWCELATRGGETPRLRVVQAETADQVAQGEGTVLLTLEDKSLWIDGTFPDHWHRVISRNLPEKGPVMPSSGFQAQFAARMAKATKILCGSEKMQPVVFWQGENDHLFVTMPHAPGFLGVIMGMRPLVKAADLRPDWLTALAPEPDNVVDLPKAA